METTTSTKPGRPARSWGNGKRGNGPGDVTGLKEIGFGEVGISKWSFDYGRATDLAFASNSDGL